VRSGSTELVSMFLNRGTSLSAQDHRGRSPLHLAAEGGYFEIIKPLVLVFKGAEVDMTDTFGKTPLQYAAERGNAAAAKELLEVGAVISMRDITGRTVRDWAFERGSQFRIIAVTARKVFEWK
jgi:ankyrin repeat protein